MRRLKIVAKFQKCYQNLDLEKIIDNRDFWKTIKPVLSNITKSAEKMCQKEGDKIVLDDTEVANVLNKHFVGATLTLAEEGGCSELVLD